MKTEFEVKFYPIVKEAMRAKLKSIGAKMIQPETLMKLVMFGNKVNKGLKVHYIRIRDESDKITLTAKIHAREGETISDQKEIEVVVSDFDETKSLLESAGLVADYSQEKLRETWIFEDAHITIDTWPEIDTYLEIEGKAEEHVREISNKLGFDWNERHVTSVTEFVARKYNITFDEALEKIKDWKFKK